MLRARATRRFEVITTRDDMAGVMQALAETKAVELEARPLEGMQSVLPQLASFFEEFAALEKKYGAYWPQVAKGLRRPSEDPAKLLRRILSCLRLWARRAEPAIAESQRLETEKAELELLRDLVEAAGGYPFAGLPAKESGILFWTIFLAREGETIEPATGGMLVLRYPSPRGEFFVAVGAAEDMASLRSEMEAAQAREVRPPTALLSQDGREAHQVIAEASAKNAEAQRNVARRIERISKAMDIADVLAHVALFRWLHTHSRHLQGSDWTVRITGWIDPDQSEQVAEALEAAGADAVLNLPPVGDDGEAPMVLSNPAWLKPFEFFPRLLGIPGVGEADPSPVVAVIAPLMFGFMFGDVGQGAVLLSIGLWGRSRYPMLALLVPGGIMAMVFGLLFGSVFSREDILPALWLHPLNEPLTVLGVALAMGIVFLLAGVVLDAVQAVWRHRLGAWVMANGGIVLAYVSALAAFLQTWAIWGVPLGLALTIAGARDADGVFSPAAVIKAFGEYIESLMRLLVSSVSFSRVGAFALAHAGLSAAIFGMADAAGGALGLVILMLGNILIIALEGLVTAIQITRLMLFEFFTRFFHASGREFRPLSFPEHDFKSKNGEAT
ncbi:V-type ATP synthase subunit I [Marimonas lutisalis]|uniref:V-type ATP synthase subunit I n=1 Tax=Marimonas lutisalis TaxID=2545756 RepID=UPI001F46B28B|nr:V-type ATPase 116kDa subunit family protein [Marimonas lutisalis]